MTRLLTWAGLVALSGAALAGTPKPSDTYNVLVGGQPPAAPPVSANDTASQNQDDDEDLASNLTKAQKDAINLSIPATPAQVKLYSKMLRQFQEAKAKAFSPPKQAIRTLVFNQSPGSSPPPIYMFAGHSTTLVFTDGNGQPWPVLFQQIGNTNAYNVMSNEGTPHVLSISPKSLFVPTNLTVTLKGRSTPLVFNLESMKNVTDSLVNIRVSGRSPTSTIPTSTNSGIPSLDQVNANLAPFLDNTPPDDAMVIPVSGDDNSFVWFWHGHFVLTTKGILTDPSPISPGAQMTSTDGKWHVYELASNVSPVFSIIKPDGSFQMLNVAVEEAAQ